MIHPALDPQHPDHYLHEATWHQAIRSRYAVDLWLATPSPHGTRRRLEIRADEPHRVALALTMTPTKVGGITTAARCFVAAAEHVDLAYIQAAAFCESEEGRAA